MRLTKCPCKGKNDHSPGVRLFGRESFLLKARIV